MALGRPSYIRDNNTTTSMLSAIDFEGMTAETGGGEDEPRRPELTTGIHCFVAMAQLTVILDEILSIFFTLSSVVQLRTVSGEHIIDISERIEEKLVAWRATYLDPILIQRFFPDVTGKKSELETGSNWLIIVHRKLRGCILHRQDHATTWHFSKTIPPKLPPGSSIRARCREHFKHDILGRNTPDQPAQHVLVVL